jgi:hypothetical protein
LQAFNGQEVSFSKLQPVMSALFKSAKPGDSLVVTVLRKDESGKEMPVDLKGKMTKYPVVKFNVLTYMDNADAQQLALRNEWLRPR